MRYDLSFRRDRPRPLPHFIGLDLGQAQEFTALAVLQSEQVERRSVYSLRHLQRWPPGTPYPQMVEEIRDLLRMPELTRPHLLLDQTGVGRAVAAMFRKLGGYDRRSVVLTAGHAISRGEGGCTLLPKKDVVAVLQVLLQSQRIKVSSDLPLAETLCEEMANFRARLHSTSSDDTLSWREREHDDLVLAVALAAWDGERTPRSTALPMALGGRGTGSGMRGLPERRWP